MKKESKEIKWKLPTGFTTIPPEVRYSKDISAGAKLLYGDIKGLSFERGFCSASNEYLAFCFDVDDKTISEWVNQLYLAGFIRRDIVKRTMRKLYPWVGKISVKKPTTLEVKDEKASVKAGEDGEGPGRGLSLNIDPRYRGSESWVAGAGIMGMFDTKGNKIANNTPSVNFGVFWDGDTQSELLNSTYIDKWDYLNAKTNRIFDAKQFGCLSNNGTKSNPALSADILGDWREEVIFRTADAKELRIFTTTISTPHRFYTFMHDPQYRLSIAWQNVGYNQPPHTSFYMGDDMSKPPIPNIKLTKSNLKK
jgi:hypothetical protein